MIVDCLADLHGHYPELEGGDLLIIAGDLTKTDSSNEYLKFFSWLHKQNYKKFIIVAGNHDNSIQNDETFIKNLDQTDYLEDSGIELEYQIENLPEEDEGFLPSGKRTLKIWGSPWTKTFEGMNPKCKAFTVDHDLELAKKWELIPDDIDILITHCPPQHFRDQIQDYMAGKIINAGSPSLYKKICDMSDKDGKERLLVCGHIHEGYGAVLLSDMRWDKCTSTIDGTVLLSDMKWDECTWTIVNASHVNEHYEPVNKPIRVVL